MCMSLFMRACAGAMFVLASVHACVLVLTLTQRWRLRLARLSGVGSERGAPCWRLREPGGSATPASLQGRKENGSTRRPPPEGVYFRFKARDSRGSRDNKQRLVSRLPVLDISSLRTRLESNPAPGYLGVRVNCPAPLKRHFKNGQKVDIALRSRTLRPMKMQNCFLSTSK